MIREAIIAIVDERRDLSEQEATAVMHEIMGGEATDVTEAQFGAFVTALRMKGESVEEITGMAKAMREHALRVEIEARPLLDTAGTGGSRKIFNASTAAAFVAAAGGAKVAKHGNRAMTSKSGSADFLEALGAEIALTPEQVASCIDRCGIGFMFAQSFHPAMKFAGPLRPQIGIRTIFNILGPLTNPAGANSHVMGVATPELGRTMAAVLANLGIRHALVVTGEDGLDDISVCAPTTTFEVRGSEVTEGNLTPEQIGLSRHSPDEIEGGDAERNAEIMRQVFAGEGPVAVRDLILANAGAGLYVTGLASSVRVGVDQAKDLVANGDAAARVAAFVEATRRAG
ncbi:MAG: anthranilate phosphoribosyltransferase [Dehalococcoidia bacterium]|nr:anthranilate phosphoribosyltransferase [Dehalococcoidia bacterium]